MKTRQPMMMFGLLGGVVSVSLAYAQPAGQTDPPQTQAPTNAWQPAEIERGQYDDIVAYNIFQPDRAALAAEARRVPEPELPDEPEPIEPVVELPPPDPDATLVLVGVSIHGPVATAHIEDRATGDVIVLNETGPFSEGRIQTITPHGLTYVVGEETRSIQIGQALTGERPAVPATTTAPRTPPRTVTPQTTPASPGGATPQAAPSGDGLTDLERRMRERRNSE